MRGVLAREAPAPADAWVPTPKEFGQALGNPLRIQILIALADRESLSVKDLADRLGETERRVRHHLERLRSLGFVESAEGTTGAVRRRRYRLVAFPVLGDDEAGLDDEQLRRFSVELLRRFVQDSSRAIAAGTFFRRLDFCNARVAFPVDARGWDEIAALSRTAVERIERAKEAAARRVAKEKEEPINGAALILWFEVPVPDLPRQHRMTDFDLFTT